MNPRGERWSRRDPDYRTGYRIGRAQAGQPPHRLLWVLSLASLILGLILLVGLVGGVLLTRWAG